MKATFMKILPDGDGQELPRISIELLNYLAMLYPNKCADPSDTIEQIWIDSGKQHVIKHLQFLYDNQTEKGKA